MQPSQELQAHASFQNTSAKALTKRWDATWIDRLDWPTGYFSNISTERQGLR